MIKLKVILGSTRPHRFSEKLVPWLTEQLALHSAFEAEFIDLRDWNLPFLDQAVSPKYVKDGQYPSELVTKWGQKIKEGEAYLVIAPEYNHGAPAVLKNAFDSIFWEWDKKPIAFVGYGITGGSHSIGNMKITAIEMGMVPIQLSVHVAGPWLIMDENENLKEGALEPYNKELQRMLDQLKWWAEAVKSKTQS